MKIRSPFFRFSALFLLCVVPFLRHVSALEVGAAFPSFSDYQFEGELPKELAGKVVVVDFWASWCAPCKAAFPSLSALHSELGPRGVVVLGVSLDEKQGPFEQFIKRLKPSFPTVRSTDGRIAGDLRVPAMPTTFVLDRAGRVRFFHAGFHGDTAAQLRREVTELLDEKS